MFKFKFKAQKGFQTIIEDINLKDAQMKQDLKDLGEKTRDQMKETIASNKRRDQAGQPTRLEDSIEVEHFQNGDEEGWGVGNIAKMNKEAPHWTAINYGSRHIVGKTVFSHFDPDQNGRLVKNHEDKDPEKVRWITFKNPIPAMNYIEKTVVWFSGKIRGLRKNFSK